MMKYELHKHIYPLLLLLLLIFITSCNRQDKSSQKFSKPGDSAGKPKPIPAGHSKIVKTQGTDKYDNVHCSLVDKNGNLWFGTTGEGVYRYDPSASNTTSFINFTEEDGLCNNNVWCILEDTAGKIWLGTSDGVCCYDPSVSLRTGSKSFINFTEEDGLCNNNVWSILEDKNGKIWLGTSGGVCYYDPSASLSTGSRSFTNFLLSPYTGSYNKPNDQVVECMFEDKKGNIWFGSWNNGGVFRYDPSASLRTGPSASLRTDPSASHRAGSTSLINFTTNDGFCDNMISGILEDREGNILFVTRDGGVCSYDARLNDRVGPGKSFTNFSEKIGLPNNNIRCILEDKNGNIWFGTDGKMDNDGDGVYRYDPSASPSTGSKPLTHFTTKDGLSNNNVFTIIEDHTGNIWFGTRGMGLCRYDPSASLRTGSKSFTDFMEKGSE